MQPNKPAAHELSSYLSCLDKGFEPEIFVEHGEVWARYARQGGRPQIAAAIDKRTAEARREWAAKSAAVASPTELRAVVDRAYTAIAAESQANVDADWADVVATAGHGRATTRPAAPTPAPADGSARDRRHSQQRSERQAAHGRAGLNETE